MTKIKQTEVVLDHQFDAKRNRHYLNGETSVLHCHHYATLYAQLADDCELLDARTMMKHCAEDAFYPVFKAYFEEHGIERVRDRVKIGEEYFLICGLGKMEVHCAGSESGSVELLHSHLDEGWLTKWSKHKRPVNFLACGFIAALFAAIFNRPPRSYSVNEIASIVAGDKTSRFNVVCQ